MAIGRALRLDRERRKAFSKEETIFPAQQGRAESIVEVTESKKWHAAHHWRHVPLFQSASSAKATARLRHLFPMPRGWPSWMSCYLRLINANAGLAARTLTSADVRLDLHSNLLLNACTLHAIPQASCRWNLSARDHAASSWGVIASLFVSRSMRTPRSRPSSSFRYGRRPTSAP